MTERVRREQSRFCILLDEYCKPRDIYTHRALYRHIKLYKPPFSQPTMYKYLLRKKDGGIRPPAEFICMLRKALKLTDDEVTALIEARILDEHLEFFDEVIACFDKEGLLSDPSGSM